MKKHKLMMRKSWKNIFTEMTRVKLQSLQFGDFFGVPSPLTTTPVKQRLLIRLIMDLWLQPYSIPIFLVWIRWQKLHHPIQVQKSKNFTIFAFIMTFYTFWWLDIFAWIVVFSDSNYLTLCHCRLFRADHAWNWVYTRGKTQKHYHFAA